VLAIVRRHNLLGESRFLSIRALFRTIIQLQRSAAPMNKQLAVATRVIVTIRKAYISVGDKLCRIFACK
jgi:hypothetical protein